VAALVHAHDAVLDVAVLVEADGALPVDRIPLLPGRREAVASARRSWCRAYIG